MSVHVTKSADLNTHSQLLCLKLYGEVRPQALAFIPTGQAFTSAGANALRHITSLSSQLCNGALFSNYNAFSGLVKLKYVAKEAACFDKHRESLF